MIDTHTHIQFQVFDQKRDEIVNRALLNGVEKIIAVGTDFESSQKAVEVAKKFPIVCAAVGIHPHHVFSYLSSAVSLQQDIKKIEQLLNQSKVVAIGETGLDSYPYTSTKYTQYQVTDQFLKLQETFFIEQIKLAIKYQKALIIHNRGVANRLLEILELHWDPFLSGRSVFHCCEPDQKLLAFAKKHQVFIGVDGDVTYDQDKQSFIRKVPLELLVLETDSPFFLPEPLNNTHPKPNEPANLVIIANFLENLIGQNVQLMSRNNAQALFKYQNDPTRYS